ncbi:MAG: glycosyltransferase [bacterium]|nr:glycosyltransferase [bacterium]
MTQSKLKILYVVTKGDIGGAQKYINDLISNLDSHKFEALILTGKAGTSLSHHLTSRWLSNSFRPYLLFANDVLATIELWRIFNKHQPDIIHLNSSKAGIIGAFAATLYKVLKPKTQRPTPKVIFTAHGWVFNPTNAINPLLRQFYIWTHRLAAHFQDHIINVSQYDHKLALKYKISQPEKLTTIHNGLDTKRLHFLDKTAARKALLKLLPNTRYPLLTDQTWIGSIGRLVKEKNYETFVKAAALINNPDIKFFIVGDGQEKKSLQSLIIKLGLLNRFFIVSNLFPAAPYLKAYDTFVLSSIKEGLPFTLLEAMAAGLPIITTRIGGMPEVVENHKTNQHRGLIVMPKEPTELARAIEHLITNKNEREKLAINAKQGIKTWLNIANMTKATENIYLIKKT